MNPKPVESVPVQKCDVFKPKAFAFALRFYQYILLYLTTPFPLLFGLRAIATLRISSIPLRRAVSRSPLSVVLKFKFFTYLFYVHCSKVKLKCNKTCTA